MPYTPPPAPVVGGGSTSSSADKYLGVPDDYTTQYGGSAPIPGSVQMRPDLNPVLVGPTYETDGPNTTAALQTIASLPPETLARLQIKMARAGLIGSSTRVAVGIADDTTVGAYKELLGIANRYGMTDTDALSLLESDPSLAGGKTGAALAAGGASDSQARTTHQSTTQRFTRLDAESLADQAYRNALGQDATPEQSKALRAALNAYATSHPSKSTTQYDADGNATTTTSGGIDSAGAGQIADNMAKAAPDYAETQAATTYFDALTRAAEAPVSL